VSVLSKYYRKFSGNNRSLNLGYYLELKITEKCAGIFSRVCWASAGNVFHSTQRNNADITDTVDRSGHKHCGAYIK